MNLDIEGALKYRGKGVVIRDKEAESHRIYVVPIELNGEYDGEWDDEVSTYYARYVNRHGEPVEVKGDFTQCWPATWYKGSNRRTSPDVVKGETVHLYEFGDTRVYFWREDPRTDYLRRLEHVEWLFSNVSDPTEENATQTLTDAYGITVSTRDKYVRIKTNRYDGEPYEHEILLDTATGVLHYKDDTGIVISAKSGVDEVLVKNANDSRLLLDKKDSTLLGTTNVNIIAEGGECNISSNANTNITAGGACNVTSSADTSVNAANVNVTCDKVALNCSKIKSSATEVDFSSAKVRTLSVHAPHAPFVQPG